MASALINNSPLLRAIQIGGFIPRLVTLAERSEGTRKFMAFRTGFLGVIIQLSRDRQCLEELHRAGAIKTMVPKLHGRCGMVLIHAVSLIVRDSAERCSEFWLAGGMTRLLALVRSRSQEPDVREAGIELL